MRRPLARIGRSVSKRHRRRRQADDARAAARREQPGDQESFDQVERFCLFIGYPRSGSSLLGSLLDAHRHVLVAQELNVLRYVEQGLGRDELYRMLRWRDERFVERGSAWGRYSYAVEGQWQGTTERLRVIGDKKGAGASVRLGHDPTLLARLETTVGVPVHVVHLVRNPYDNIATMAAKGATTLPEAVDAYLGLVDVARRAAAGVAPERWCEVHLESLVAEPRETLARVCGFLGVDAPDDYLAAAAPLVFGSARRTRDGVAWTPALLQRVRSFVDEVDLLARYRGPDAEPSAG